MKNSKVNKQDVIAAKNAAFEALSPAEKRVYIARDVLAQLHAGTIEAENGTWVSGEGGYDILGNLSEDKEVRDLVKAESVCSACALGGLFVAAVCIADKLKVSELDNSNPNDEDDDEDYNPTELGFYSIKRYLRRFFSSKQIDLIEIAFEGGYGGVDPQDSIDYEAQSFFDDIPEVGGEFDNINDYDSALRMRLIMENIVANKGTFRPLKRPQSTTVYKTPGFND